MISDFPTAGHLEHPPSIVPPLPEGGSAVGNTFHRAGWEAQPTIKNGETMYKYQAMLIVFGILTVAAAFRLLGALVELAVGRAL